MGIFGVKWDSYDSFIYTLDTLDTLYIFAFVENHYMSLVVRGRTLVTPVLGAQGGFLALRQRDTSEGFEAELYSVTGQPLRFGRLGSARIKDVPLHPPL